MTRRGFSLLEAIVVLVLFGFAVGGLFWLFQTGSASVSHAALRQGLQSEVQRFSLKVKRDVSLTHALSFTRQARSFTTSQGQTVRRDAVAFLGLSDWNQPARFDPALGLPQWDRYIVYYATNDQDRARLIRQEIQAGAVSGVFPYFALGSNLNNLPDLNASVASTQVLSQALVDFRVEPVGSVSLDIRALFREQGLKRAGGAGVVDEALEAVLLLKARNTFPEL